MCRVLSVARLTLSAWTERGSTPSAIQKRQRLLGAKIVAGCEGSSELFGCRRVCGCLNCREITLFVGMVAKLMPEVGLVAKQKWGYEATARRGPDAEVFPDKVNRNFDVSDYSPGEVPIGA